MSSEQHIPVGKLGRPHGISGAFRFQFTRTLRNKKKLPAHFLIEAKGRYIPFFVAKFSLTDVDGGMLNLEDITTPEVAKQYSGSTLYLTEKDAETYFKEDADAMKELIGYTLIDETVGKVGEIIELMDTPAQVLATVKGETKEYTIPLVDDLVIEVNKRKKEIRMDLPEGLLDL